MNKLNKLTMRLLTIDYLTKKLRPYIPFSALNAVWRKLDKSSKTILDVGCGKGEPMAFINRKGKFKVVGIDILSPTLTKLKKSSTFHVLSWIIT
jgi:2-polyprenyl-3-methyl-5-hydroxy-6-metoxy-1,4-benzoquinol methylase